MKLIKTIAIFMLLLSSCATRSTPTQIPTAKIQRTPTPIPQLLVGVVKMSTQVMQNRPNQNVIGFISEGSEFYILAYLYQDAELWLLVPAPGKNAFGWVKGDSNYIEFKMVEVTNEIQNNVYNTASLAKAIYKNSFQDAITWYPQQVPEVRILTPTPQQDTPIILCGDTSNKVGEFVTCKIDRAYCEFLPGTNGDPTFCNDAPYPNHNFTLVVFGQDWSDYDGKCIIISGTISAFDGKPQIETKNRARISECP
jgi:hypothetical protein